MLFRNHERIGALFRIERVQDDSRIPRAKNQAVCRKSRRQIASQAGDRRTCEKRYTTIIDREWTQHCHGVKDSIQGMEFATFVRWTRVLWVWASVNLFNSCFPIGTSAPGFVSRHDNVNYNNNFDVLAIIYPLIERVMSFFSAVNIGSMGVSNQTNLPIDDIVCTVGS